MYGVLMDIRLNSYKLISLFLWMYHFSSFQLIFVHFGSFRILFVHSCSFLIMLILVFQFTLFYFSSFSRDVQTSRQKRSQADVEGGQSNLKSSFTTNKNIDRKNVTRVVPNVKDLHAKIRASKVFLTGTDRRRTKNLYWSLFAQQKNSGYI